MNEIKNIEVEIDNLGENPDLEMLLGLITEMESVVNGNLLLPHPLLKPELIIESLDRFGSIHMRNQLEGFDLLETYIIRYSQSCQNFILKTGDAYWQYLNPSKQRDIEGRILDCIDILRERFLELGFYLKNFNSLRSIAHDKPEYSKIENDQYLSDEALQEVRNEINSAPKIVAVLQMSGLLDILKDSLSIDNPTKLAQLLALTMNHRSVTLRRALSDLQTQLNGTGDVRNTAFTNKQRDFLERVVDILKRIGLSEQEIRSKMNTINSGDD